jgi:N-acetyltransferase
MQTPVPITLEHAPVQLVPLGPRHSQGLRTAAADGNLSQLRYASVPEPEATDEWPVVRAQLESLLRAHA